MDVVGIGEVGQFCARRGWRVREAWGGSPLEYRGSGECLVWGGYHPMFEFYYIKFRLLRRGVDLIPTQDYGDLGYVLDQFVSYAAKRDREGRRGGKVPFGWRSEGGELVPVPGELAAADEILLLRENGMSLRGIERWLAEHNRTTRDGRPVTVNVIRAVCAKKGMYR